jgi:hypothetical protein
MRVACVNGFGESPEDKPSTDADVGKIHNLLDKPYRTFGYNNPTLGGFAELARRLADRGKSVRADGGRALSTSPVAGMPSCGWM